MMYCQTVNQANDQEQGTIYMFEPTFNDQETFVLNRPESFFEHCDELEVDHYDAHVQTVSNQSTNIPKDHFEMSESHPDLIPTTLAVAKKINEVQGKFLFRSLLDHGGSHVMIQARSLPKDCEVFTQDNMNFTTTAGKLYYC